MRKLLLFIAFASLSIHGFTQCANPSNIYSFVYNGKTYEVVKENKTWVDAADCAVERGGILTEINDVAEQNAIFTELNNNASITTANTIAPDGGGASYAWIGGNDLSIEGNWVWDGNNDSNTVQFWMGTASGSPVGGLYNNWGNEPDNFGSGQDGLALALTNWPLGVASQWNDVDHTNTLYYVIEYDNIVGVNDLIFNDKIEIYPNPFTNYVTVIDQNLDLDQITISDLTGKVVKSIRVDELDNPKINLSILTKGTYLLKITAKGGQSTTRKIIK